MPGREQYTRSRARAAGGSFTGRRNRSLLQDLSCDGTSSGQDFSYGIRFAVRICNIISLPICVYRLTFTGCEGP